MIKKKMNQNYKNELGIKLWSDEMTERASITKLFGFRTPSARKSDSEGNKTERLVGGHAPYLPSLYLEAISGSLKGKMFEITQGRNRFGRDLTNAICLMDNSVSAFHGTVEYLTPNRLSIYDGASTNGISFQ